MKPSCHLSTILVNGVAGGIDPPERLYIEFMLAALPATQDLSPTMTSSASPNATNLSPPPFSLPQAQPPSLTDSYGALFIGMCISLMQVFFHISPTRVCRLHVPRLYGLAFHQVYRYYRLYPDDSKRLKGYVSLFVTMLYAIISPDRFSSNCRCS